MWGIDSYNLNKILWFDKTVRRTTDAYAFTKLIQLPLDILNKSNFVVLTVALPTTVEQTTHIFFKSIICNHSVSVHDGWGVNNYVRNWERIDFKIDSYGNLLYKNGGGTSISDNSVNEIYLI